MQQDRASLTPEELHELLQGDDASLRAYFNSISHSADLKEFLEHADRDQWPRLIRLIEDPEKRADVVLEFDEGERDELLSELKADEIATIVQEMESDDAADLIGELEEQSQYETLRRIPAEERRQVQQLLHYPEDTAGGIMQIERAQVQRNSTVADAISTVRKLVEDDVEVIAVWVVDNENRLVGTLALTDLLLHKSTAPIEDLIDTNVVTVQPLVDQEQVASLFKKYNLITLPVVDEDNHLLGRIVVDDVVDVLSEEAEEDALRMGGTSAEELLHPEEVLSIARIRLPWLAVAWCCSLISASFLKFFDPVLEKAIILNSFLPVITAMGGNVGTQTATILIRGFATGKSDLSEVPTIWFKELRVSLVIGILYGVLSALVATFLLSNGNYYLGFVVLIAMASGMMISASLGVIAPSILKRIDVDPAIASGPFVTTISDITGIITYMLVASYFLHYLAI